MQRKNLILRFLLLATLVFPASISNAQIITGKISKRPVKLTGRVVASLNSITFGAWSPKYQSFLFLPEAKNNPSINRRPTRILYKFFKPDNYLKREFFDYSKLYELKVLRKPDCDERLNEFGYETMSTEVDGKTTETEKIKIFKLLSGVQEILFDENEVLSCYALQENNYILKKTVQ